MERLTERDEFGNADIIGVESADLQFNLMYDDFNRVTDALNKLAEYEELEEQGLMLRLPCKVGDTVYEVTSRRTISEYQVRAIRIEPFAIWFEWKNVKGFVENSSYGVEIGDIGKTVFLTKEEAEQALEEMKNN